MAEALAIYTALKRHSASVHTYCDGFACSAATIIFCAGDVRTMGSIALLMIHNCMSYLGYANSSEMRKAADDNDKINQSSVEAYKAVANISEDEIKAMMEAEAWLTAEECLKYGFATEIAEKEEDEDEKKSEIVSDETLFSDMDYLYQALTYLNQTENHPVERLKTVSGLDIRLTPDMERRLKALVPEEALPQGETLRVSDDKAFCMEQMRTLSCRCLQRTLMIVQEKSCKCSPEEKTLMIVLCMPKFWMHSRI